MKIGLNQINRRTPKRVKAVCEAIAYTLTGVAALAWVNKFPDLPVILLLIAGVIDKHAPRIFGYDEEEIYNETHDQPNNNQPPVQN